MSWRGGFTAFNREEDEALQGLPALGQLLYLRGIRPLMDRRTRMVGLKSRVSWNGFRDVLEVDRHQGERNAGKPSRAGVRRMADRLVTAGLLKIISNEEERRLIFFLPLADVLADFEPEKPGTKPAHPNPPLPATEADTDGGMVDARQDAGLRGVEAGKPATKAGTKPTQQKPENPAHIHYPYINLYNPPCSSPLAEGTTPPPVASAGSTAENGNAKPPKTPARRAAVGTRLPEDWRLPMAWAEWAMNLRKWTREDVEWVEEVFRDHWLSSAGRAGVKANWELTWRNWVRKQGKVGHEAHYGAGSGGSGKWVDRSAVGQIDRAIAERKAREAAARDASGRTFEHGEGVDGWEPFG